MVQNQPTTKVNDVSAALGDDEYTHVLTRMEGSEDEANQITENGATAATRSELDMWEAARSSDSATNLNAATAQQVGESELTEDTVRMYFREIGRVPLLTAADEVVLARAVELAQRLEAIEKEIQDEVEIGTPDPFAIITDILSKLGQVGDTASAVAKYLGLRTPVTLEPALTDPDLRVVVDSKREEELINYLSDALGVEPDEAHTRWSWNYQYFPDSSRRISSTYSGYNQYLMICLTKSSSQRSSPLFGH